MAVTKTETVGWSSRLGDSLKGILFGLGLFVAGFPVLFWNEGNTLKTAKALEEGQGVCVSVESNAEIDQENSGKLVHMSGKAETDDVLEDSVFGIKENAISLKRKVEMYQWVEESRTTEKKKVGGSVERTTTYTYKKEWVDHAIDSSTFEEAGHDNPGVMEFEGEETLASTVRFGAFRLSEKQIKLIGDARPLKLPADFKCPLDRVQVKGPTIYVPEAATRTNPLNNREVAAQPRIGDMRVTFEVIYPHDISLVAKQHNDTFVPYVAKNGKKVSLLDDGIKDAAEMFADAQSANSFLCWMLRLVGFLMMLFGVKMVLRPLSVVLDVLPFLGNIAEVGLGIAAFVIAAPCALVTIAVAWLFYRPVAAVILIAAAGGIVYWFRSRRKAKKSADGASAPAADGQHTPAS